SVIKRFCLIGTSDYGHGERVSVQLRDAELPLWTQKHSPIPICGVEGLQVPPLNVKLFHCGWGPAHWLIISPSWAGKPKPGKLPACGMIELIRVELPAVVEKLLLTCVFSGTSPTNVTIQFVELGFITSAPCPGFNVTPLTLHAVWPLLFWKYVDSVTNDCDVGSHKKTSASRGTPANNTSRVFPAE